MSNLDALKKYANIHSSEPVANEISKLVSMSDGDATKAIQKSINENRKLSDDEDELIAMDNLSGVISELLSQARSVQKKASDDTQALRKELDERRQDYTDKTLAEKKIDAAGTYLAFEKLSDAELVSSGIADIAYMMRGVQKQLQPKDGFVDGTVKKGVDIGKNLVKGVATGVGLIDSKIPELQEPLDDSKDGDWFTPDDINEAYNGVNLSAAEFGNIMTSLQSQLENPTPDKEISVNGFSMDAEPPISGANGNAIRKHYRRAKIAFFLSEMKKEFQRAEGGGVFAKYGVYTVVGSIILAFAAKFGKGFVGLAFTPIRGAVEIAKGLTPAGREKIRASEATKADLKTKLTEMIDAKKLQLQAELESGAINKAELENSLKRLSQTSEKVVKSIEGGSVATKEGLQLVLKNEFNKWRRIRSGMRSVPPKAQYADFTPKTAEALKIDFSSQVDLGNKKSVEAVQDVFKMVAMQQSKNPARILDQIRTKLAAGGPAANIDAEIESLNTLFTRNKKIPTGIDWKTLAQNDVFHTKVVVEAIPYKKIKIDDVRVTSLEAEIKTKVAIRSGEGFEQLLLRILSKVR